MIQHLSSWEQNFKNLIFFFLEQIIISFMDFFIKKVEKQHYLKVCSHSFFCIPILILSLCYCVSFNFTPLLSTRRLPTGSSSSRNPFLEGLSSKSQWRKEISNHKVLQPIIVKEAFLREFKPYENICQGLPREFFTEIPDWVFPNYV